MPKSDLIYRFLWYCEVLKKVGGYKDKMKTSSHQEKENQTHGQRKMPLTLLWMLQLPSQKQKDGKWYS